MQSQRTSRFTSFAVLLLFAAAFRFSVHAACAKPGQASMRLEGFHTHLPSNWDETVRHEFGHALGLEHEHQHPDEGCEAEFLWEDEPGYVRTYSSESNIVPDDQGVGIEFQSIEMDSVEIIRAFLEKN